MKRPNSNLRNSVGSASILNSVRRELGGSYAETVGVAVNTVESIRQVGEQILAYSPNANAFLGCIYNRIAFTDIKGKMYKNPWAMFKKGILEYGETIEEIFVNLCDPQLFNPVDAENTVFKRVENDVRSAFHSQNMKVFYEKTINDLELKKAFLSIDGVVNLVDKMIESMYKSAEFDEYIMTKYMIQRLALDGKIKSVPIVNPISDTATAVATIKGVANDFTFLKKDFNMSGVHNFCEKQDCYIMLDTNVDANVDVKLLATAFNMEMAEFTGHRVLIDGFSTAEEERLALLMDNYVPFTSQEKNTLKGIQAIMLSNDFFMIYDNEIIAKDQYNGKGLYYNYFLHVWKTFSASPFENAVLFSTILNVVDSVTVTPSAINLPKNVITQLGVEVLTSGFAPQDVEWTIDSTESFVDDLGRVRIGEDETETTVTVTATSTFDPSKKDTCVITVV
jgi:hypothetical protein